MISITQLSLQRGTRQLLENVNLTIQSQQKVRIYGVLMAVENPAYSR